MITNACMLFLIATLASSQIDNNESNCPATNHINKQYHHVSEQHQESSQHYPIQFPLRGSCLNADYISNQDSNPSIHLSISYNNRGKHSTQFIGTLEPEGRSAEIESVFTLQVKRGETRRLFIIASWPIEHSAILTSGKYYRVFVFKADLKAKDQPSITRDLQLENFLGDGFDGMLDGADTSYPYKTYESIKNSIQRFNP